MDCGLSWKFSFQKSINGLTEYFHLQHNSVPELVMICHLREFTFEIGVVGKMKKLQMSSSIYVVVFFLFSNM